jgi:gamma-glutamylcyclotransferase (GGCT)/AIG2-like uncharacterized protein YtfP
VRGPYSSVTAVLPGHARYAIAGETYPGMVTQTGAAVEGTLYLDIDGADLARLDAFEGADYRRAAVDVYLPDGANVAAQAYLYNLPQRLLDAEWKADEFDIRRFLYTYCSDS